MITFSKLGRYGRLGNQLFQYSFVKAASLRHGVELALPANDIPPESSSTIYEVFDIPEELPAARRSWVNVQQTEFHYRDIYDQMIRDADMDLDFLGYFQSERFFADKAGEIKELLRFKSHVASESNHMWARLTEEDRRPVCSLHVRRTDTLKFPEHHPVQPVSYYEEAVRRLPGFRYLMFSDDIPWCRQNLSHLNLTFVEGTRDYHDINLLSRCAAHIIANSTFSWWGAWLSGSNQVIAPKMWFGPRYSCHQTKDLYPSNWVLL